MISAIILAAGESKRMGHPKMLLPWGNDTVLGHVISTFKNAGVDEVLVITGGAREAVESLVSKRGVRTIYNEEFANGEMLSSIQCGIRAITPPPISQKERGAAVLIGLGDQPQVQERSVWMVCEAFRESKSNLIVPSYQMRRGHPWLAASPLWDELLKLKPPMSPRDFLNAHQAEIHYVSVDDPGILADLDTPEDYLMSKP